MADEAALPHFPALAKCMLIESRLTSRHEIVKDLKASALFETVMEAISIPNGLGMLRIQEVDACIIGPSVSLEKALHLLKTGKNEVLSKDCAFICIVERGSDRREPLLEAGAHGVLERPSTKLYFTEQVVAAVIRANKNSPWVQIFQQAFPDSILLSPKQDEPKVPEEKAVFIEVLTHVTEGLRDIMQGSERGEYLLNAAGYPTPKTLKAISEIAEQVLAKNPADEKIPDEFKEYFEHALISWFIDYINQGEGNAIKNLRNTLLRFSEED